ncbi:MAG: NlpC/P60 family protein [Gordonia sp. (in: high G+C Gram-positive bacteria)]|uniref:NlpC/P60 family protein n=1 Tax=Gordonia sp. (in: high G+C Gram-positive bacteria) TaxID=84139 RepID=UPI0039E50156
MKRATNDARKALRGGVVVALVLVGALTVGTAGADPRHASPIANLVNRIAAVDQNLVNLTSQVAAKRERVNKTLVDYQNAVAKQAFAAAADDAARKSLKKTEQKAVAAQREFDDFMRAFNRNGNNLGSMTDYVSSENPGQVLDRATSAEQFARAQRTVIRNLQQVRAQQAKRVAATKVARKQAASSMRGAKARRDAAIAAVEAARKAVAEERGKRAKLLEERNDLIKRLEKLRGRKGVAAAPGAAPNPRKAAEGDPAADAAAEAAKLALGLGTQALGSSSGVPHAELLDQLGLGEGDVDIEGLIARLGNALGSSGGGGNNSRPGLRGPQAVELVVNRARSQLGVPYAWGGGNGEGPTLGIRDGGVADAHGDFDKIGFDCSGLMVYAFAGVGIDLPKYSGYQYTSGPHFPLADAKRGDMLFWGPGGGTHVALYLGDGQMIEAPQSGDVVKISPVMAGALPEVVRLL